ncbi:putative ankyrin repeat protein [Chloropicon roscoffensis]|uniref:Ankyrin repeat protein n=1 Tax=Chloropicon roscoffensis TaxID=1461544 RepID=A0AAX4PGA3_9CHLO
MTRGAGEPSTKRAKVDEADEEEDPLMRRKEELVRLLERARKGKDNARAKKELVTLCARLEAKNEKLLGRLLPELWQKIVHEYLHPNDLLALAMTCRFFREKQKDLGGKLETDVDRYRLLDLRKSGKVASHSLGWFQWVCDTMGTLPGYQGRFRDNIVGGVVWEGNLVNYAAFQGSVEILRWLIEEKGCELNEDTGWYAGSSGSVEVLEYVKLRGYEFTKAACDGAAMGGCLEALKFLRGLNPPCPWDEETCEVAARGGHLEVLKWARSQDPPCPWNDWTCAYAAHGGHLEVLKVLRSLNPPCPWNWRTCAWATKEGHFEVLKWLRDQDPPCPWDEVTCALAAGGGHLDFFKWLRSQDPPCPWNWRTCFDAAEKGHLDVLKWARSQDPPCPWYAGTCAYAAEEGQLEVLNWLRDQDPPCPWSRRECRKKASLSDHQHIVNWIDQREDESDVSDTDRSYEYF